jgi:glycosyltransferase involved in cell wall biosynthesis
MNEIGLYQSSLNAVAFIGNFLPRQCGIATFTTDLLEAFSAELPEVDCWAMAMNDIPEGYLYPPQVRFEMDQKALADFSLAADFLNMNRVDVICLQHEYGIYGGSYGTHILELLHNVRMPVVTTLHTVLREPDQGQKSTLQEIGRISERLVVMSHAAQEILVKTYDIPNEKIVFIHHGIPDVPFIDPNYFKDQFGCEGLKVILTFGLLSPGKGIEDMIDALPGIIDKHSDTKYIVLGATHPHVKRREGESYRLSLQQRARDLGVEEHVVFYNRFVNLQELTEFLGAADVYVTPYLNQDQITSGTLAYALGAGKATVSTPYFYAKEMLADGRGRLVPIEDPNALAEQIIDLLDHDVKRNAMRKKAYTFCRNMIWKEVARRYFEVFLEVLHQREQHPKPTLIKNIIDFTSTELPRPNLDHIKLMTDDVGILQHAKYSVPNRSHGYCTDDNARALIAIMMARDLVSSSHELDDLACRYLSFLDYALNETTGRFRNFMGYDRSWMEDEGSEDSHARSIWGLGSAVSLSKIEGLANVASSLFKRGLPILNEFQSPRAWAFALVGIHEYSRRFSGDSEVRRIRRTLSERLFELYQSNATDDWPWIEDAVNYANAKIPQALLLSGQWLQHHDMIDTGLCSLEWLVKIQTDPKGYFIPIGNKGWYSHHTERTRFDQQPIEAQSMIEACIEAYYVTGDGKWIDEARRAFDWFLGRNDLSASLYDFQTGGCCDGLTADGPNLNQGAESTLAYLLSLLSLLHLISRKGSAKGQTKGFCIGS